MLHCLLAVLFCVFDISEAHVAAEEETPSPSTSEVR
jgi:hypothetical protein